MFAKDDARRASNKGATSIGLNVFIEFTYHFCISLLYKTLFTQRNQMSVEGFHIPLLFSFSSLQIQFNYRQSYFA